MLFSLLLLVPSSFASAEDLWLHVHVDEGAEKGERVRVNLPLSVIEQVVPLIQNEHLKGGKIAMPHIDEAQIDLQAMWAAVRDAADGEFVSVESERETVRVAKSEGMMLVHVDGDPESGAAKVRVTVPLAVVDALTRAGEKELDLMAAISELKSFKGDLVTVEENGSRVRIWIDEHQGASQ
jgi:hypothetical protein